MSDAGAPEPEQAPENNSVSPKKRRRPSHSDISLPRRSFLNQMPDRGLFLSTAITGFTLIAFLNYLDFQSETILVSSILLMASYGAAAFYIPAVHMRPDRLGDNFYYLGFIFTLASLSAALWRIRYGTADMTHILGNFGIALGSTIFGIAGRVAFVQMRTELDDVETKVREDILSASNILKGQLNAAVREFETFSFGIRKAGEERLKIDLEASTELAKTQLEKISDVAVTATAQIESTFAYYETQAARMRKIIDGMLEPSENAVRRMNEARLPIEHYHNHMYQFIKELDDYAAGVGSILDQMQRQEPRPRWWQFWRRRTNYRDY